MRSTLLVQKCNVCKRGPLITLQRKLNLNGSFIILDRVQLFCDPSIRGETISELGYEAPKTKHNITFLVCHSVALASAISSDGIIKGNTNSTNI